MKKRRLSLIMAMVFALMISACITDHSPQESAIDLNPGESQTFTVTSDSSQSSLVWYLDDQIVAEGVTEYTFTAQPNDSAETIQHTLVVKEGYGDSITWTINIPSSTIIEPVCWIDEDGDGFGSPDQMVQGSSCVDNNKDCDDGNSAIHPDAQEVCNGIDDNCDGQIDEGACTCTSGDGICPSGCFFFNDNDCEGQSFPQPTTLPTPKGTCPVLTNGMMTIGGAQVSLTVGPANTPGPMLFYWHATGMTYSEVNYGFREAMADVKANGGVIASFASTTSSGRNTGNGVWYTGDIDVADEILACALEQNLVDPRRIHVSGYSAGGLQCAAMSYLRSGYVASVLCMSGGFMTASSMYAQEDPSYLPAAIAAHGASGSDVLVLDFAKCSENYCTSVTNDGGLAINCNDGGDHIGSMLSRSSTMGPVAWKFFKENQFGTPQSYPDGLPSYFPNTCSIY